MNPGTFRIAQRLPASSRLQDRPEAPRAMVRDPSTLIPGQVRKGLAQKAGDAGAGLAGDFPQALHLLVVDTAGDDVLLGFFNRFAHRGYPSSKDRKKQTTAEPFQPLWH
jgi:hypothetical protein